MTVTRLTWNLLILNASHTQTKQRWLLIHSFKINCSVRARDETVDSVEEKLIMTSLFNKLSTTETDGQQVKQEGDRWIKRARNTIYWYPAGDHWPLSDNVHHQRQQAHYLRHRMCTVCSATMFSHIFTSKNFLFISPVKQQLFSRLLSQVKAATDQQFLHLVAAETDGKQHGVWFYGCQLKPVKLKLLEFWRKKKDNEAVIRANYVEYLWTFTD